LQVRFQLDPTFVRFGSNGQSVNQISSGYKFLYSSLECFYIFKYDYWQLVFTLSEDLQLQFFSLVGSYIRNSSQGAYSARKVYSQFWLPLFKEIQIGEDKEEAYALSRGKEYNPTKKFVILSRIIEIYGDFFAHESLKNLCFRALHTGFSNTGKYLDDKNSKLKRYEFFNNKESLLSTIRALRDSENFDSNGVSPGIMYHQNTLRDYMEAAAEECFKTP
jgi:hypothetical protein